MSRILRSMSPSKAGRVAFTPRNIVIRQQSAIIHNIRLLELHNTLHLKEETPIKVLDICSHENAQMRQELGEMGVKTSQASSEASKLKSASVILDTIAANAIPRKEDNNGAVGKAVGSSSNSQAAVPFIPAK